MCVCGTVVVTPYNPTEPQYIFSKTVQNVSGAHPASYPMDTGVLSQL